MYHRNSANEVDAHDGSYASITLEFQELMYLVHDSSSTKDSVPLRIATRSRTRFSITIFFVPGRHRNKEILPLT